MRWAPLAVARLRSAPLGLAVVLLGTLVASGCSTADSETEGAPVDRAAEAEYRREYLEFTAGCLTEAGFPSELMPNGSVKTAHGAQYDEFRQAGQECDQEFGPLPSAAPASDEELSKFYDLQVESYECLVEHGHNPMPPPSRETYIAQFPTGQAWDAYLPAQEGQPYIDDPACPRPQPEDIEW